MNRLIKKIRDGERIHYFYGYPRKECKKIFKAVDRKFKGDVREISDVIQWKDIKAYKETIKIIHADNIINKYRLGEDFRNLINDGSIYLLFSREKIHDFTLKPHWLKFIKELDDSVKYEYKLKKNTGEFSAITPSQKKYRRTTSLIFHCILNVLLVVYFFSKYMQKERLHNFDLLIISYNILESLNLFWGIYIAEFLKKWLEPFIENQMGKYNKGISNIKNFIKNRKTTGSSKKDMNDEDGIE